MLSTNSHGDHWGEDQENVYEKGHDKLFSCYEVEIIVGLGEWIVHRKVEMFCLLI